MKKVRITAIRKTCYPDLMEKYENPIQHAILLKILVGVPEDHRVNVGQVFGDFLFVVHQKEPAVLNLEGQRCGDMLCPRLVVVAPHHINRGYFL